MKYITLIYEYAGELENYSKEDMSALIQQHKELQKDSKEAKAYVGAVELKSAENAKSIRTAKEISSISDGPFSEAKEVFVGFYIFDCADLDSALNWAGRIPTGKKGAVEVRPLDSLSCEQQASDMYKTDRLTDDMQLYTLLIYQAEAVIDAYTASEMQQLIQGNQVVVEGALAAGHYMSSHKLMPSVATTTIQNRNGQVSISDGPFSEAKEVLLGLHIIACETIEVAISYAQQIPDAETGVVELRPVNFYEQAGGKVDQWTSSQSL